MHQKPWSRPKSCQERRSREPFVYTFCWIRFTVLNGLLLSKSMDVPLPCAAGVEQDDAESSDNTPSTNSDLKAAESHYD